MTGFNQILVKGSRVSLVTALVVIFSLIISSPTKNEATDYSALKNNPADTSLRIKYVLELLDQGKYADAQTQLKIGYDFDKKNVYLNGLLNKILVNSGEIGGEIEKTLAVLNKIPDYGGGWARLSSLYETVGKQDQADLARAKARELGAI